MKPYNKLSQEEKDLIIKTYKEKYVRKETNFKDLAKSIGVSERAFSRVLKENDINTRRRRVYTLNESYFNNIDSNVKAYLLGIMLADGTATNYNYVSLQMVEKDIVELLKNEIEYDGELYVKTGKEAGGFSNPDTVMYRINFSSEEMSKDLIRFGKITNNNIKDFPKIEHEYIHHFLRGYFDADGSITVTHSPERTRVNFSICCTYEFAKVLKSFFEEKLEIYTSIDNSHTDYMCYLRSSSIATCIELYKYLYKDCEQYCIKKKKEKWLELFK